ncbi:hypothetical protein [Candidatus Mycolicibacterium alkanivorans]|uniref:ESX-1 secretion-associated protein n=1 Tax=Candidatus Mycolicibacterium alkanivorans TaxID=2954114 RepID=A0ABS9YQG7_9MYCO|nr:hypothetical protein [Candidatus Mycolicibacterium alkanivorans]MCI4673520.1 hypothetical protein [Candidatus Mycolicibacterium alkanivorans]
MSWFAHLEDLVASATAVACHGDDLAARHLAADGRTDSAASGWTGRSAAALNDRAARWAATSTALLARIGEHAVDLHTCAHVYSVTEAQRAQACEQGTW